MAQRVLAVLGAVALVLVAVVLRNVIDGDGDGGRDGGRGGEVVGACDTALRAYCQAMDGVDEWVVEDSATTSAALVKGNPAGLDLWVTSDAWQEVTTGRARSEIGSAELLATTPVVVASAPARADALGALCAEEPLWRCLGERSGQPWGELGGQAGWGTLRVGLPDADTATGLSVLASVAAGHFGALDFAANDFDATGFRASLTRLTAASGGGDPDPLATLVRRQGTYSAAGVLAARAQRIAGAPPVLDARPMVEARVVLVDLSPGGDTPDPGPARSALVADGWVAASGPPAALLKPGVLGALHDLWKDVAR